MKITLLGETDGTCTPLTYKLKGSEHYMASSLPRDRKTENEMNNYSTRRSAVGMGKEIDTLLPNCSDTALANHLGVTVELAHYDDHSEEKP